MLEMVIIIALVMAITQYVQFKVEQQGEKAKEEFKQLRWVLVIGVAVILNILNAGIWGEGFVTEAMKAAAKEGIIYGIEAAGIYGLAKPALQNITGTKKAA